MADKAISAVPRSINYFPGMPKFTAHLKGLGYRDFKLMEDKGALRGTDEVAYDVYFGERQMGRFTIRRHGNIVERNLFLTYPNGQMISLGPGGTVIEDLFRQAEEWAGIFWRILLFR